MNYLVSRCKCKFEDFLIEKDICYAVDKIENCEMLTDEKGNNFLFDIKNKTNIIDFKYNMNRYYVIDGICDCNHFAVSFMSNKNMISISSFNSLKIYVNGTLQFEDVVQGIVYDYFETVGELTLIFFSGVRNYIIILEKDKLKLASHFDEVNDSGEEKYFMCKLNDSLNHGKVIHIFNKKVDNYLVYLDENELNLKHEFVASVFIDCFMAGNFNYCNNLLEESIQQEQSGNIKNFFCETDYVICLEQNTFAFFKKNTLAGIYKFEVENLKIVNIICIE